LPNIELHQDLSVNVTSSLVELNEVRLDVASLQATLKGSIRDIDRTPKFDLQLGSNEVGVANLLTELPMLATLLSPEMTLKGRLQLTAAVKGVLQDLHSTSQIEMRNIVVSRADGASMTFPKASLSQTSRIDQRQSVLHLAEARLQLPPVDATLKGSIRNFAATPQLDLQLATKPMDVGKLMAQIPMLADALPAPHKTEGQIRLQGVVKGTPARLQSEIKLGLDQLAVRSGTFNGAKAGDGLRFETDQTRATLGVQLAPARPAEVSLNLHAKRLLFDQVAEPAASQPPAPSQPAAAAKPPPLNLRGKLTIDQGQFKQLQFRQMVAQLTLIDGLLKSTQTFKMYGGAYNGKMQADLTRAKPDYQLQVRLADVKADHLINDMTSVNNVLLGILNTELAFSGRGLTWPSISKTLTGTATVNIDKLKLTTLDLMPKLTLGLQSAGKIAGFSVPAGLGERSFDALQGGFRVAKGKLQTDNLKLLGKDVEVYSKGTLGLDQSLDFQGTAFLLGALADQLGKKASFLLDKQGRVKLPFVVRGSVTQPKIIPDDKYLLELAKKSLLGKATKETGKQLEKLLDKPLLGKPEPQKPAKAEEGQTKEPEEALKKGLKGLLRP
jgi:hypothetical protein